MFRVAHTHPKMMYRYTRQKELHMRRNLFYQMSCFWTRLGIQGKSRKMVKASAGSTDEMVGSQLLPNGGSHIFWSIPLTC